MSQAFFSRHRLFLTPLSPIHLGCGEHYEPTNYVITDGVLYAFDPVQAELSPPQLSELWQAARAGTIDRIQRYFHTHAQTFVNSAYHAVAVSRALEKEYREKAGKPANREAGDKTGANSLEIERTIANPQTHQPYIPGSAFKGCLRTTVLERMVGGQIPQPKPSEREAARFEKDYLGSFASDGFRLLKTADFMPTAAVATQIQYATNHKKAKIIQDGQMVKGKNVTGRRETIQHGQYRAFAADCTIQHLLLAHRPPIRQPHKSLPQEHARPHSLQQLAQDANRYHLHRFEQECALLEPRGLIDPDWLKHIRNLLAQLQPKLDQGSIMLLRLGKHGGAESKTIESLAQIKIMQGEGQKPTVESKTTTVWLAAQAAKETHGLLPFGWVLVEIDPQDDNTALKQWCTDNGSHLPAIRQIHQRLAERKARAAERKAALQAAARQADQERIAKQRQQAEEAARREAELAAMAPAQRLAAVWMQKLKDFVYDDRNRSAHTQFYQSLLSALEQAATELAREEQIQLAELMSFKKMEKEKPSLFQGKREKEIKAVLRRLRGE
ncbi:RAMP superfamily CRISPR-associated protein [Neisseria leonii]|uniref:RAMP superfamily CRISPR-associated protein n=1 Tax=Neisseria leonii TaxID=2995413 RepID=UPI00237AC68B|nr:RAMP superfamily CRISPR-associated protein [Neisseria sp. 3986]MDD9325380.1 RAMP superfamily CRISPR-associated protein [Neisseria sp. 3986]